MHGNDVLRPILSIPLPQTSLRPARPLHLPFGLYNKTDVAEDLSQAISQSWTLPLWPTIAILVVAMVYLRGWRLARVTRPLELPAWRAICFLGGLLVLWLALASPIDALGQFLLLAHMTQHWALMSVVPPLLVLGAPVVPFLRGLPRQFVREDLAPWMNAGPVRTFARIVGHPAFGWLSMNLAFLGWHVPAAYELALRSNGWHDVEHGCFLFTSIAFWWFVIRPWPSHNHWSRWLILPYLISADLVNTGLSAFLAFCGRVVYPTYAAVPRIFDISALNDQSAAGAEMWVLGSIPFLVPAAGITLYLISSDRRNRAARAAQKHMLATPPRSAAPFDLLRLPIAGRVLQAKLGRVSLQAIGFAVMTLIVFHGLTGTPASVFNLAGAPLWNILRPLNLIALLLIGNIFCMACPFTLPREVARLFGLGRIAWPTWLKNKWPSVFLLILFFWAYESFDLWDSPRATAWVLIAYVVAVLVVDSIFREASFCKYVCPIGQFNFVASLLAPLELGIRGSTTCNSCTGHDCINGNATHRGCELHLYLPNKIGNLDCTLCMDCVKACPHDNIVIAIQPATRDLVRDPVRSSIRRLSTRVDIAFLFLVITFSAVLNAAVMTQPVADYLSSIQDSCPYLSGPLASLGLTCALSLVLLIFSFGVAYGLRLLMREQSTRSVLCRIAVALLPLGLAMWAAHLSFHLASTTPSVPIILQHVESDLAENSIAKHLLVSMQPMPQVCRPMDLMLMPGSKGFDLLSIQLLILDLGLLLSLYAGWRFIRESVVSKGRTAVMLALWATGAGSFYALCTWIFTLPMEMRGMGM